MLVSVAGKLIIDYIISYRKCLIKQTYTGKIDKYGLLGYNFKAYRKA